MNLKEYLDINHITEFEEDPYLGGINPMLESDFIYDELELDLKIHLAKVVICKCFNASGGICGKDSQWFIRAFLNTYQNDILKPWLTSAIQEAMEMIIFFKRSNCNNIYVWNN